MTRGRNAEKPTEISLKGLKDVGFRLKDEIAKDHVGLISAGVAFYALLALFPAITALVALGGLVFEPEQVVSQMEGLSGLMPQQVSDLIIGQAVKVAGSQQAGLGLAVVLGILLALYSASKGMGSLMEGLNVAYDEEEKRNFFMLKLQTYGLTVALIIYHRRGRCHWGACCFACCLGASAVGAIGGMGRAWPVMGAHVPFRADGAGHPLPVRAFA